MFFFFLLREDLNQLEKLEEDLNAEIVAADKTVALTEEMCATLRQRIPELTESEKNEKDQVKISHLFLNFKSFNLFRLLIKPFHHRFRS